MSKAKNLHKTIRAFAFGPYQYSSDTNTPFSMVAEIRNMKLVSKILSGEYRGLSPAYKVRKWECSVCHGNLEECIHEVGKTYNGITCQMIAKDIEPIEISIVDVPQDPRCRIIDLLIIENKKQPKYIWYGFKVNTEQDRFRNIQTALEKGYIPEKVAFFFAEFFSIHPEGKVVYIEK